MLEQKIAPTPERRPRRLLLVRAVLAPLLAVMTFAASIGGDGGLVNIPGGGGIAMIEATRLVEKHEVFLHRVNGILLLDWRGVYQERGPISSAAFASLPPASAGPTSVIRSSWVCTQGITRTVETKVGSDYDLALKRHDRLCNKMLQYYPRPPENDPVPGLGREPGVRVIERPIELVEHYYRKAG